MLQSRILYVANMSFNAIREKKILAIFFTLQYAYFDWLYFIGLECNLLNNLETDPTEIERAYKIWNRRLRELSLLSLFICVLSRPTSIDLSDILLSLRTQ